jgi:hypothetical protein
LRRFPKRINTAPTLVRRTKLYTSLKMISEAEMGSSSLL